MVNPLTSLASMLTQALKLHSTFPALCWLVLNWLIFVPYLQERHLANWWTDLETAGQVALVMLLALFIGYTLDSLNFILLGQFESGAIRSTWWGQWLAARQRRQLDVARQWGDTDIPAPYAFQPTRLGNELNAGKASIARRYGIDAVNVWPHLMAVLSETGYTVQIEREKANLDFFLNLSALSALFAAECAVARLCLDWHGMALLPWTAAGMTYVFYRLTIPCAKKWYAWINAAFDLYRYELAERLALKPFTGKMEETRRWKAFSYFIWRGTQISFGAFRYPLPDQNTKTEYKASHPEPPSGETVKPESLSDETTRGGTR